MIPKTWRTLRRFMPAISVVFFLIGIVSVFLHIAFFRITPFADFFNQNIASLFRACFAHLTNWIPFSVAETIILSVPVIFVFTLILCIRNAAVGWHRVVYCITTLLSIGALLYGMFVWTFAAGYQATPLEEKMELKSEPVSAEQLLSASVLLADGMEQTLSEITFRYGDASVMPFDYTEMSRLLVEAYDSVCDAYPFIQRLHSRIKPVALSEPWTYTHISGVYTMFTGEANLNVNFPDYVLPFTAAHELAHQRGIAREDEANFVAFLVCIASDNPYIRYSGYLNMYEYVSSALYKASKSYYTQLRNTLDTRILNEIASYNRFFAKYRETVIANVSETVNNTYLVMQGTSGTKSYGMVVDLAVAYLLRADT